ncbi:MAG: ABC transporter ATP-binding protein [Desulfobacterales bacterium]|nr:ABC transporter ATP-binding protein [Desulfobacterales bacterium]
MLLEVKNLIKKYDTIAAVDGISFSIKEGICFGLLGPNGAGKTTTIEVIEGILPETSGEILYKGKIRGASFKEEIGIQFQQTALLESLTLYETLKLFKTFYKNTYELEELTRLCNLEEILHQRNNKVSGGQRQRLMLSIALINNPDLLFLDEPSTGLDPQARRNLWDIVQTIKSKGKTIVLTTHYMEEAQILCDEIAIMDHGKIIAHGTPNDLIKKYCSGITVILPADSFSFPLDSLSMNHKKIYDRVEIYTDDINKCLKELMTRDIDLTELIVRSPNLEDVFLKLTGRHLRN